mgnify:CR=1 FL=1
MSTLFDLPFEDDDAPAPPAEPEPPKLPDSFVAMIDRLDDMGQLALAARLRHGARLVRYSPPEVVFSGSRPIATDTLSESQGKARTDFSMRVEEAGHHYSQQDVKCVQCNIGASLEDPGCCCCSLRKIQSISWWSPEW